MKMSGKTRIIIFYIYEGFKKQDCKKIRRWGFFMKKNKKIYRFNSLFGKIFTISILCMLIPMLISLFSSVYLGSKYLKEETSNSLLNIAIEKRNQIEQTLSNLSEQVSSMITDPYIIESFEQAQYNKIAPARLKVITDMLEKKHNRANGLFENLYLMNLDTVVADGIGGISVGYSHEMEEETKDEMEDIEFPNPYVTEPAASPMTGRPTISIMGFIEDHSGNMVGVVGMPIELNILSKDIVQAESRGFNTIILDRNGLTISSANPEQVLKLSFREEDSDLQDFYKIMKENDSGIGYFTLNGVNNIAAFSSSEKYGMNIITYKSISDYLEKMNNLKYGLFTVIFISVIISAIVIFLFSRKLTKPILTIAEHAEQLAEGNLALKIPERFLYRKDEMGKLASSFDRMTRNLRNIISKIINTSDQVASFSQELSASGEHVGETAEQVGAIIEVVASGAEEQSAQVEGTLSNLGNLLNQINEVNQSTDNMEKSADYMMGDVAQGGKAVIESIEKIKKVKNDTESVFNVIIALGNISEQIGQIVELISSVAEQTNLLALNAAIEAARAGEAGRGFSVVADEIRDLAEESAGATNKITGLINEIRNGVYTANDRMESSINSVNESVEAIEENGSIFEEINSEAEKLKKIVDKVSYNVQTMTESSNEYEKIMNEINKVSQEFASSSEEVAASSEEQIALTEEIISSSKRMADMAEDLSILVRKFKM